MKFHKNIALFCVFLFTLLVPYIKAESSAYSIVVNSNSNVLNNGDEGRFWIYADGEGEIKGGKFSIYLPVQLLENASFETYVPKFSYNKTCYFMNVSEINWEVHKPEAGAIMSQDYFIVPMCQQGNITPSEFTGKNPITEERFAPLNIKFNVSNNALPGDYFLKFYFYYQDGNNWYKDEDVVTIHVTTFYERNEIKLWCIGSIIAVFSLFLHFDEKKVIKKLIKNNFLSFIILALLAIRLTLL